MGAGACPTLAASPTRCSTAGRDRRSTAHAGRVSPGRAPRTQKHRPVSAARAQPEVSWGKRGGRACAAASAAFVILLMFWTPPHSRALRRYPSFLRSILDQRPGGSRDTTLDAVQLGELPQCRRHSPQACGCRAEIASGRSGHSRPFFFFHRKPVYRLQGAGRVARLGHVRPDGGGCRCYRCLCRRCSCLWPMTAVSAPVQNTQCVVECSSAPGRWLLPIVAAICQSTGRPRGFRRQLLVFQ